MENNIFDILPNEIVHKIFEYLTVLDRNEVMLTCLRFYEISQHILFMNEIELKFNSIQFNCSNQVIKFLVESKRHYSNVSLKCIDFDNENDYGSEFWLRFGNSIKTLKIEDCEFISLNQIISILKQVPNLKTLVLDNVTVKYDRNNAFDPNELDNLKGYLKNVTTFTVKCWCRATNLMIPKMIDLLPNIENLTLKGYRETPPVDDNLTLELLNQFFLKQAKQIKTLNIQEWCIFEENLLKLTEIKDFDLEHLELTFYYVHPNERYENLICDFLKTQKHLKSLKLSSHQVIDSFIATICKYLKDLKVFELNGSELTDIGMIELQKLQNLETLTLKRICMDPLNLMMKNLDKFKYDKLRKLDICFYSIEQNEENYKFFKELTQTYKNLTELKLDVNESNDFMLQTIIKNVIHLRKLKLTKCSKITDYGLTGDCSNSIEIDEENFIGMSISNLKNLKYLDLKEIEKITEKSFVELSNLKNLKELLLISNKINIKANKLNSLLKKYRALRILNLYNCGDEMANNIEIITNNLPRLKCYYYI